MNTPHCLFDTNSDGNCCMPACPACHPENMPLTMGRKFDGDKLRWDLLPLVSIQQVVEVLTLGAAKYAPDNWRYVEDGMNRYFAAAMRHLVAYRLGEELDPESGLPHLAHAMCNLIFLSEIVPIDHRKE